MGGCVGDSGAVQSTPGGVVGVSGSVLSLGLKWFHQSAESVCMGFGSVLLGFLGGSGEVLRQVLGVLREGSGRFREGL